jgi:hypothetical protein
MCRYVVFQIFHLSSRPEMYSASMLQKALRAKGKGEPPLPPIVLRSYVPNFTSSRGARLTGEE